MQNVNCYVGLLEYYPFSTQEAAIISTANSINDGTKFTMYEMNSYFIKNAISITHYSHRLSFPAVNYQTGNEEEETF